MQTFADKNLENVVIRIIMQNIFAKYKYSKKNC